MQQLNFFLAEKINDIENNLGYEIKTEGNIPTEKFIGALLSNICEIVHKVEKSLVENKLKYCALTLDTIWNVLMS